MRSSWFWVNSNDLVTVLDQRAHQLTVSPPVASQFSSRPVQRPVRQRCPATVQG